MIPVSHLQTGSGLSTTGVLLHPCGCGCYDLMIRRLVTNITSKCIMAFFYVPNYMRTFMKNNDRKVLSSSDTCVTDDTMCQRHSNNRAPCRGHSSPSPCLPTSSSSSSASSNRPRACRARSAHSLSHQRPPTFSGPKGRKITDRGRTFHDSGSRGRARNSSEAHGDRSRHRHRRAATQQPQPSRILR